MLRARQLTTMRAVAVFVALLLGASLLALPVANAQAPNVVIAEVVAADSTLVDAFGETSDWIELHNAGSDAVDLGGWTIADGGNNGWVFPAFNLGSDERVLVFASGRDVAAPEFHTGFSLKSSGEQLRLANPSGGLVDEVTFPGLGADQAWGRGSDGNYGYLISPTPGLANTGLLPALVTIDTGSQTFFNHMSIEMSANLAAGETIRYTTNGEPVTAASTTYGGPVTIDKSTVVRAAVVGNGLVGAEASAGYTALGASLSVVTSDLPIVLVHSTGVVGDETQDAIVTVIEPGADGRSSASDPASYGGFAGLRVRGASSANFDKKQYKFETWSDLDGVEVGVDLLGMGADSDWVLYAPGRFDRAMINNPLMYELGDQLGVATPEYRFVELFIEDNATATVGDGDYLGLYILRESIEIDDERLDLVEHSQSSAGPDGGYIVRYDWNDDCCSNLQSHPDFGSKIAVDSPSASKITDAQLAWIDTYWSNLQTAAADSFEAVDPLIDFDDFLDGWLLSILAMDVDVLRASHYMHLDAGGQLRAGPLWDFDRALGSADERVDELAEARDWRPNGNSGHSYKSDIYEDLWALPEVQARLRSRWAELRQAELSDAALHGLIDTLGAQINESYWREINLWNDGGDEYGPRFGGALQGELTHMKNWVAERTEWLDEQFLTASEPPQVTAQDDVSIAENDSLALQIVATDAEVMVFDSKGLPDGLTLDQATGLIEGTVGYGDGGTYLVKISVTDSTGASTSIEFEIEVSAALAGAPAVLLNEYNAVAPGSVLGNDGSDTELGQLNGNGGDWFEIVTLEDNLDLRGWMFDVWSRSETGSLLQSARLILADEPLLSNVRAGSIITVAESLPDDLSYDPANGDWTINLQSNNAQDGAMFANQTNFDTNNAKWRLVIRDATEAQRALTVGETGPWDAVNLGVATTDVLALRADPSAQADPVLDWIDTTVSTFGVENTVDGLTQDFSLLRPVVEADATAPGDVNCDVDMGIVDALLISQYAAGNRSATPTCPMSDPTTEIVLTGADVNGDGNANIVDALLISQCVVGVQNLFCPD